MRPQPSARPGRTADHSQAANDAAPVDIRGLVDHIVDRYHKTHLGDLARAIDLADQVEQLHADEPGCPRGLGDRLRQLAHDLRGHQRREELTLFPLLRIGTPWCLDFATRRMADDHAEIDRHLLMLQAVNASQVPIREEAFQWRTLAFLCHKLETDLREHARLEHEVLYAALLRRRPRA